MLNNGGSYVAGLFSFFDFLDVGWDVRGVSISVCKLPCKSVDK
jgi:hypothetical protein